MRFQSTFVRDTAAQYGTDAQRQELINDPSWYVRATVARYGNEAQRQELINDEVWAVRKTVAMYGTEAQRRELINARPGEFAPPRTVTEFPCPQVTPVQGWWGGFLCATT